MLVPFVPECRVPALLSIISKLTDPKGYRGSPHVASDRVVLAPQSLGEAGEIVKRAGDEPLPAWILGLGGGSEQLEKVPRARCRFGARRGGSSIEKVLQFFLAIP